MGTQKIREQWKTWRLEKDLYQNQDRDIACIFLDLEAKNCLFPGHMGSKTWGLKARWSWCCFIAVFEKNSLGKTIPAPDINICGLFIVLYHPCFCCFPVVWITEPRGRRELFDSGTRVSHVLHILFHLLMLFIDYWLRTTMYLAPCYTNKSLFFLIFLFLFFGCVGSLLLHVGFL